MWAIIFSLLFFCRIGHGDDVKFAVLHDRYGQLFLDESELKTFNEFVKILDRNERHLSSEKGCYRPPSYMFYYWTYHYNSEEDPMPKMIFHMVGFDVNGYPGPKYFLDMATASKISDFCFGLRQKLKNQVPPSTSTSVDTEKRN